MSAQPIAVPANRRRTPNLSIAALFSLAWLAGCPTAAAQESYDLAPSALSITTDPAVTGGTIGISHSVVRTGDEITFQWGDSFYLSTDGVFDGAANEFFLGTNYWSESGEDNYTLASQVSLPQVQPGTYHLFVVVDGDSVVTETDENNNVMGIAFEIKAPNLTPTAAWFTDPPVSGLPGEIHLSITNTGNATTHTSWWYDSVYLSTDNVYDEGDTSLGTPWIYGPLAPAGTYTHTLSITVPDLPPGTYHLIVRADTPDDRLAEGDETDNTAAFSFDVIAPDLIPTAAWFSSPPISGLAAELNLTVANQGNGPTHGSWWYDSIYLSTDDVYDEGDTHLGSPWRYGPVAPDETYTHTFTLPSVPSTPPGSYYLIVRADTPENRVAEGAAEDNTVAFPVTITAANLWPTNVWFTTTATPGENLEINLSVTHSGDADLPNMGWTDSVYFSADNILDGSDTLLWTPWHEGPLAPGGSYTLTGTLAVPPVPPGEYFLIATADLPYNGLPESSEADNTAAFPVILGTPDLHPDAAGFDGLGMSGETASVVFTTRNVGNGSVGSRTWYDRVYLSSDDTLGEGDTLLVNHFACNGPLGPDATYLITSGCQLPPVAPGNYYLIVSTDDYESQVPEADEGNNVRAFAVQIVAPDLVPTTAEFVGGTGSSGEVSQVRFTIANNGAGSVAHRGWWDRVYFSEDAELDGLDTLLVDHTAAGGPLPAGGDYSRNVDVYVPQVPAGIYYLIVCADTYMDYLPESDESNNIRAFAVNVISPDLRPDAAAFHDGPASSGEAATVDFTIRNTGAGGVSARGWWDRVYLSPDIYLDAEDHLLVDHTSAGGPLAAGAAYSASIPVNVPRIAPGTYYLLVSADEYQNYLIESDEANNVRAFEVTVVAPDLVSSALVITSGVPASEAALEMEYTVSNLGDGPVPAGGSWWDMIYFSNDPVLDPGDTPLLSSLPNPVGPVAPGGSYTGSVSMTLPALGIGTYYLIVTSDFWSNQLLEESDENNATAFPIKIGPDLEPRSAAITGGPAVSGRAANLSVVCENTGNAGIDGTANWTDHAYLSSDPLLDAGDTLLESLSQSGPLAAGSTRTNDLPIILPDVPPGDYHLILACDQAGNTVEEATESNNVCAYPVRITAPDLVVGSVTPEATQVVPGQFLGVGFIITNQGDGAVFTGEMWNDDLWFSTDAAWDSGDILLGGPWSRSGPFSPTASYDSNRKVLVPSVTPGTYYLIVRTDVSGQVGESDNTNNFRTAAIEVLSPDLTPDTLAVTGQLVQGRPFVCEITVNNAGQSPVPAGPWQDTLHLSSDPTLDGGDLQLGGPWNESGPLATGAGYTRSRSLNLPNVTAGTWYLIVTTDHGNDVAEADETNNIRAFAVTVRAVDLVPTAITAAAPLVAGLDAELTVTVTNEGDGTAPAGETWHDHLYFSTDDELGDGDLWIGSPAVAGPLAEGAGYQRIYQTTLPAITAGNYFLIAETDINGTVIESNDANNRLVVPVVVTQPDLSPVALALAAGNPLVAGQANAIEFEVANQGTGPVPAGVTRTDTAYLSSDPDWDPGDTLIGGPWTESGELAASASYTRSRDVTVTGIPGGTYFLILVTDHEDDLFESDEADNSLAVEIQVDSKPNLRPTSCAPGGGLLNAGQSAEIAYTITNEGTAPATGIWWDSILLSTDAIPDPGDYHLGWGPEENGPVESGSDYSNSLTTVIPDLPPGDYYLLLTADGYSNGLTESDEDDNLLVVSVIVGAPDLRPTACAPDSPMVSGQPNLLGYTMINDGTGEASESEYWYDSIYLSADAVLDPTDTQLGTSGWETGSLAPGASYERTMKITVPTVPEGSYYLIACSDDTWNSLFEGDEVNNAAAFPVTITAMDLRPTAFALNTGTLESGATVILDYTAVNGGSAAIPEGSSWWDAIYLSADAEMGPGDIFLGWSPEILPPLASGATYSNTLNVTLPTLTPGTWHLLVMTDAWADQVIEGDETNNVRALEFTIGESFSGWAAANGLSGEDALPGANPSGDGISNQLKYAFGMDPNIAYGPDRYLTPGTGSSGLPAVSLSGGRLRIEFVRRINATDLTYTAQFGSDLTNSGPEAWLPSEPGTVTPISGQPGWERVIVEDGAAPPGAAVRFGRVAVAAD